MTNEQAGEAALLPCPFCGESEIIVEHNIGVYVTHRCKGRVDLPLIRVVGQTSDAAIAAWNTRAPVLQDGQREALVNRLTAHSMGLIEHERYDEGAPSGLTNADAVSYGKLLREVIAALTAVPPVQDGDWVLVPKVPTEDQWGGLARSIMMWLDFTPHTPRTLFQHLERGYGEIPDWLRDEPEMKHLDHVPSKGTRCAIIYLAMIAASPPPPMGGSK